MPTLPYIELKSCPKKYDRDLDKSISPEETIRRAERKLAAYGQEIYAGCRRIDAGRLGIPVYLGLCGGLARQIMPVRKQMGKGSSEAQARASAIMELMERYAFFSFWQRLPHAMRATWTEAEARFGASLLPVQEMLASVQDTLDESQARELLDLHEWLFYPATRLGDGANVWIPIDWFRMLGEFNGSSAGNTNEESLLQGISELVERHVCAIIDRGKPILPTISLQNCQDPALAGLAEKFRQNGIQLILKDFSLDMPLPTVGALAWDPATFPDASEIVFTAGTAASPAKAAIRAITEVAQLGGDFCQNACYEASGLPKFSDLSQIQWLLQGPETGLEDLPNPSGNDIFEELKTAIRNLEPLQVYAIETTCPELGIPAHYCIIPGLQFRERDKNQSLGLFIGRQLAENHDPEDALKGLRKLALAYPDAHFLPFFEGMIALRAKDAQKSAELFSQAFARQPDNDAAGLAAFYAAYALSQENNWEKAMPWLEKALQASPRMKEAANLLGVAHFKLKDFSQAEKYFDLALRIDKGSAIDLANRGLARKFQGKLDSAREDLENALALEPDLDFARRHLAQMDAQA